MGWLEIQVLMIELEKSSLTVDNMYDSNVAPGIVTRSNAEAITYAGKIQAVVQKANAEVIKLLEGLWWRVKRS